VAPHAVIEPSAGAPTDSGYTKIYSNWSAFAALKADGSITAWGNASTGGAGAPVDNGYTKIYSTQSAFVANKFWYSHYQRVHLHLLCLSYPTL
jgi:hypothetical protein